MPLKLQKIVTNDYCLSFWAKIMARSNTMAPLCAQADDRTIWPHQRVSFCSSQVEKNSVFFNRMIHVTILCSHLKAICSGPGFQNWTVSFSVLLPEMLTACTGAAWTSCHTHPQWKLMWKWSKRTGSPDKSSTFWPLWCATNNTPPYHPIWHSHLTKQCRLWWTRAPSCSSFWGFMAT